MSDNHKLLTFEDLGLHMIGRISLSLEGKVDESLVADDFELMSEYIKWIRLIKLQGERVEELLRGLFQVLMNCLKLEGAEVLPAFVVSSFLAQREIKWLTKQLECSGSGFELAIIDGRLLLATKRVIDLVRNHDVEGVIKLGQEFSERLALAGFPLSFIFAQKRGVDEDEVSIVAHGAFHAIDCDCAVCETSRDIDRIISPVRRSLGGQIIALCDAVIELNEKKSSDPFVLGAYEKVIDNFLHAAIHCDLDEDEESVVKAVLGAADIIFFFDQEWSRLWIWFLQVVCGRAYLVSKAKELGWDVINGDLIIIRRSINPISEAQPDDQDFDNLIEKLRQRD